MCKAITVFILSIFLTSNAVAQDKLVKNNGDTIYIKVIKFNRSNLVYSKIGMSENRKFTTPHSRLNKLIFRDGRSIDFSSNEFRKKMNIDTIASSLFPMLKAKSSFLGIRISSDTKKFSRKDVVDIYDRIGNGSATRMYLRGKKQNRVGNLLGLPAGYFLGRQIYIRRRSNLITFFATVGAVASLVLNYNGKKNMRKSVDKYNKSVNLKFGASDSGIGLNYNF